MKGKRKNRQPAKRKGERPASPPARKGRLIYYLQVSLRFFVPLTILVGIYIYWPRKAHPFVPGLGIEADCSTMPEVKMMVQVTDNERYRLGLIFGDLRQSACTKLRITLPADLIGVIQLHPTHGFEEMSNDRRPFTNFILTRNALQQPVLDIPAAELGPEPLALELNLRSLIPDSFEKFRLLVPTAVTINNEPALSKRARILLESILIPTGFDILSINPPPSAQKSQLGVGLIYFNAQELTEVNILLLDRRRDTWKYIFNACALAIAMSVVAARVSRTTQA